MCEFDAPFYVDQDNESLHENLTPLRDNWPTQPPPTPLL